MVIMKTLFTFNKRYHVRSFSIAVCTLGMVLLSALHAKAYDSAFRLKLSGNANVPTVEISNMSRDPITRIEMTIGDTSKHFDMNASSGVALAESVDGEGRFDAFALDVNLNPGESLSFRIDIDNDPSENTGEDYRMFCLTMVLHRMRLLQL